MLSNHIIPYRAIRETRPANSIVASHEHTYFHMIMVVSGKLTVICGDENVELAPKTAILVPPESQHSIYAPVITQTNELKFGCENAFDEFNNIFKTKKYWTLKVNSRTEALFNSILYEASKKDPFYIEIISSMIIEILYRQIRFSSSTGAFAQTEASDFPLVKDPDESNEEIRQIVDYMKEHMADKTYISDIAKHFGYSVSYFTKVFKKAMGMSPHRYMTAQKITVAKSMIRQGNLNFTAISDSLNFSNTSAFTNTFKKFCNVTPSQYAKLNRDCTYINLLENKDLPADNVRFLEYIPVGNSLKFKPDKK